MYWRVRYEPALNRYCVEYKDSIFGFWLIAHYEHNYDAAVQAMNERIERAKKVKR